MKRATKDERFHKRLSVIEKTQDSCCKFGKDMLSMIQEDRKQLRNLMSENNTNSARLSANQLLIDKHDSELRRLANVVNNSVDYRNQNRRNARFTKEIKDLKLMNFITLLIFVVFIAIFLF